MRLLVSASVSLTILLASLQSSRAIYSHYENCSEFLIGNEKRSYELCPTEIEEAEMADSVVPMIDAIPDFVDASTLDDIKASIADAQAFREKHQLYQRFISHVNVGSDLVAKMRGAAGFLPVADRATLPTVSVEGKSSVPHIDCYANALTNEMEDIMDPNDRVGFLWVGDDSSDGTGQFRYGDTTLPIKAGTFVHFRGDLPHYTVLPNGGSVSMLGPFALASPKALGSLDPCEGFEEGDQGKCSLTETCQCIINTRDRRELRNMDDMPTSAQKLNPDNKDSGHVPESNARKLTKSGTKAGKSPKESKASKSPKGSKDCPVPLTCSKDVRRWLQGSYNPTPEEALAVVKEVGGDVNAHLGYESGLLSGEECDRLIKFADEKLKDRNDGRDGVELVKFLGSSPLADVIAPESARRLYRFFKDNTGGAPITQIWIRREESDVGVYRDLHADPNHSAKIYLNDDFEGGEMIIVDQNGPREILVDPGTGIAHSAPMVHGTMPLRGTQYLLYIIGDVIPGATCIATGDTSI